MSYDFFNFTIPLQGYLVAHLRKSYTDLMKVSIQYRTQIRIVVGYYLVISLCKYIMAIYQ